MSRLRLALAMCGVIILAANASTMAAAKPVTRSMRITDAGAEVIGDRTVLAWQSMDPARIKALYAPDIVGFDMTAPSLSTNRATWDRMQDAFADARIDKATQVSRTVQVLDPDTFVMSGAWNLASTANPDTAMTIRCTDVFHMTGGKWLIVNEHCSQSPKAM